MQTIQINIKEETLQEISEVQKKIHSPSVSDTVRRSIGVLHVLTNYISDGRRIIVESTNGDKTQLIISGMD